MHVHPSQCSNIPLCLVNVPQCILCTIELRKLLKWISQVEQRKQSVEGADRAVHEHSIPCCPITTHLIAFRSVSESPLVRSPSRTGRCEALTRPLLTVALLRQVETPPLIRTGRCAVVRRPIRLCGQSERPSVGCLSCWTRKLPCVDPTHSAEWHHVRLHPRPCVPQVRI